MHENWFPPLALAAGWFQPCSTQAQATDPGGSPPMAPMRSTDGKFPAPDGLSDRSITMTEDPEWRTPDPGNVGLLHQIAAGAADTPVMRQHDRVLATAPPSATRSTLATFPATGRRAPAGPGRRLLLADRARRRLSSGATKEWSHG